VAVRNSGVAAFVAGLLILVNPGALLLAQPASPAGKLPEDSFDLPEPAAPLSAKPLHLWGTWYHVHAAKEAAAGVSLLGMSGEPLSRPIEESAFCRGALGGSIRITESSGRARTYNFAGIGPELQADCGRYVTKKTGPWVEKIGRSRFKAAKGSLGDGAAGYALVPLRTIAVDKARIPFESVLYIPEARGVRVRLPDGRAIVHDGYFFAADTGGAIKGSQIDIFTGLVARNPFPALIRSSAKKRFDAYVIEDPAIREHIISLHQRL
jgi:3D (Asp-Asp-Asp) domain-containing protein